MPWTTSPCVLSVAPWCCQWSFVVADFVRGVFIAKAVIVFFLLLLLPLMYLFLSFLQHFLHILSIIDVTNFECEICVAFHRRWTSGGDVVQPCQDLWWVLPISEPGKMGSWFPWGFHAEKDVLLGFYRSIQALGFQEISAAQTGSWVFFDAKGRDIWVIHVCALWALRQSIVVRFLMFALSIDNNAQMFSLEPKFARVFKWPSKTEGFTLLWRHELQSWIWNTCSCAQKFWVFRMLADIGWVF